MTTSPAYTGPIPDEQELNRMLDKVMVRVFRGSNAAFLGSLLCSHEFHWVYDTKITETAATDGRNIWWNVNDFMRCTPEERHATVLHELWHTGLMHNLRQGNRDAALWQLACDHRINLNLIRDGHNLPQNGWWIFDHQFDNPEPLGEEQIYDLLQKQGAKGKSKCACVQNPLGTSPQQQQSHTLGSVVRAVQAAQQANQAGSLPGNLQALLNKFLQPKVDWRTALYRWMTDLSDNTDFSWKKPNRRFLSQDIFLPSNQQQEDRLEHLVYFQDVSGSISDADMIRFNSEVKYVQEELKPKKLTLVQFDTQIQYTREFTEDEPFEEIEIHGRGGTSLAPVHEWIETHKPTAAVIFSDLWCAPMAELASKVPVIWAVVNNQNITVPFGTVIYITND